MWPYFNVPWEGVKIYLILISTETIAKTKSMHVKLPMIFETIQKQMSFCLFPLNKGQ